MRLSFTGILTLLFAFMMLTPAYGRDSRKKKPHTSVGNSVIIEPDRLVQKTKTEKSVAPQEDINHLDHKRNRGYINTKYKQGIDVSHYQHSIDWEAVGTENLSYVYLKATEGASLVDSYYKQNLEGARKAGLSVGSYHFYRPNVSWKQQLENMTSVVKADDQDIVPMIDIEVGGGGSTFISNLRTFIEAVEEHYGKKPILYTYQNFYNKHLQNQFKDYDWMIASYKSGVPKLSDGRSFIMWQYSAKGRIAGIKGDVDRSQIMEGFSLKKLRL